MGLNREVVSTLSINGVKVWESEALPSYLQQVEYVQSNGTAYVDTGLKGNNGYEVRITADITGSQTEGYGHLFGTLTDNTKAISAPVSLSNGYLLECHFGDKILMYPADGSANITIVERDASLVVNSQTHEWGGGVTSFTTPDTILLFRARGSDDILSSVKMSSCIVTENSVEKAELTPCVDTRNNKGCFYDWIRRICLYGHGADLISGPVVQRP